MRVNFCLRNNEGTWTAHVKKISENLCFNTVCDVEMSGEEYYVHPL